MTILAYLVVILGFVVCSNALTIGPFQNLTSGVRDIWKQYSPENINQGRFGLLAGRDHLYMVSRRLYRKDLDHPWDPASRGGIVSSLKVSANSWTHSPYDRLTGDEYGEKLFFLNGRAFMLTFGTAQKRVSFHKLFFWHDESKAWLECPADFDQTSSTILTEQNVELVVSVPDQTGKTAYFAASASASFSGGSEIAFSKLDVDFRANVPVKGTLRPIAREQNSYSTVVDFLALKGDVLYAFYSNMYSEGFVPIYDSAYAVDLVKKSVQKVDLNGTHPTAHFDEEKMFQVKDYVLIVGGIRVIGISDTEKVRDIWAFSLTSLQWMPTNVVIPENSGENVAFDQQSGKLFLVSLENGVKVAQVTL